MKNELKREAKIAIYVAVGFTAMLLTSVSVSAVNPPTQSNLVQSGDIAFESRTAAIGGSVASGVLQGPIGGATVFTPGNTVLLVDFSEFIQVNQYTGPLPETASVNIVCKIDGVDCGSGPIPFVKTFYRTDPQEDRVGGRYSFTWIISDVSQGPHTITIFLVTNSQGILDIEANNEVLKVTPYRQTG